MAFRPAAVFPAAALTGPTARRTADAGRQTPDSACLSGAAAGRQAGSCPPWKPL